MSKSSHGIGSRKAPLMLNASRLRERELEQEEPRSEFEPFVVKHWRRCGSCGERWEIICLNGADAPSREPYWRCVDCRAPFPPALPTRLPELVAAEQEPQLELELEPSEAAETLHATDNEKSRHEAGSESLFGESDRSLPLRPDNLNSGGRQQHGH